MRYLAIAILAVLQPLLSPNVAHGQQTSYVSLGSFGSGELSAPQSIALDGSGNTWVTDTGHCRVIKYNSSNVATLTLGGGTACPAPTGTTLLNQPLWIVRSIHFLQVVTFLRGEGNNVPLADGLKKQKRWWIDAAQFPLDKLVRCCGPEEGMEYRESEENWNRRINSLVEHLQSDGKLPPFIAAYNDGVFSVRDGNHRLGACEKLGAQSHETFIWCDSEEDFERVKQLLI